MPTPSRGHAAASIDGRMSVFGGEQPGLFDEVEVYDPILRSWATMEPMPRSLHGIGAVRFGRAIYLFGGGMTPGGLENIPDGYAFYPPSR